MKLILFFVAIACLFMGSCCKKKQIIPTIRIEYPNLAIDNVIVTKSYNQDGTVDETYPQIIDVDSNPFIYRLSVLDKNKHYIINVFELFVDTNNVDSILIYSDSISDVQYELKGRCEHKLKGLSYSHNGVSRAETSIVK